MRCTVFLRNHSNFLAFQSSYPEGDPHNIAQFDKYLFRKQHVQKNNSKSIFQENSFLSTLKMFIPGFSLPCLLLLLHLSSSQEETLAYSASSQLRNHRLFLPHPNGRKKCFLHKCWKSFMCSQLRHLDSCNSSSSFMFCKNACSSQQLWET